MNARPSILALGMLFLASAAQAQSSAQPDLLGEFRDWAAFTYNGDNGKVCFAYTQPSQTRPDGVNRDPVHMFVTHRPAQGVRNEINVITGYPYRDGSQASAQVDDATFSLFTREDGAWVQNASDEGRLIAAMRAGRNMEVSGTSQRGTETRDTYSLLGVSAALDRIDEECN